MDYRQVLLDKKEFLKRIDDLPLYKLWENFSSLQVDLFFEKELQIFSNETWWVESTNILEIDCRDGYFCFKLSEFEKEKNFLGIDKKQENVQYANKYFSNGRLSFQEGEGDVFDKALESRFDIVILRMSLQHLKNPIMALSHVYHYLNLDGRVLIIDSHDSLRKCSYSTPYLNNAVAEMNLKNKKYNKGNRFISFEIQTHILNRDNLLSSYYELESSNMTKTKKLNPNAKTIIIHSDNEGGLYFLYNMLFLQILKKNWQVEIDFDKAYDEARYFLDNKDSWLRPGKHYLTLKKKSISQS